MASYEKTFKSDIVHTIQSKAKEAILCITENYSEKFETRSMITRSSNSAKIFLKDELQFLDQEVDLKKRHVMAEIDLMALQQRGKAQLLRLRRYVTDKNNCQKTLII